MDYPFEKLAERYSAIPLDVRDAMLSVDVGQKLQGIGELHRFHLDQLDVLADEVSAVMLGLTHPNDFKDKIRSALSLSSEEADGLVREVDEEIFKPIKASLMSMHQGTERNEQMDHVGISADEILRDIEKPWRATYKTEPIELELTGPRRETPAMQKTPPVGERVAPEIIEQLPPSFRRSFSEGEPSLRPSTSVKERPIYPEHLAPSAPKITLPPKEGIVFTPKIQSTPASPTDTPPANLPTGEPPKDSLGEKIKLSEIPDQKPKAPPSKSRFDPYREPTE